MESNGKKLLKENGYIDIKQLKLFLIEEYNYIKNVFSTSQIPDRKGMLQIKI